LPPQMDKLDKDTIILSGYQILVLLMFSDFSYLIKSNMTAPVCGIFLSASSSVI